MRFGQCAVFCLAVAVAGYGDRESTPHVVPVNLSLAVAAGRSIHLARTLKLRPHEMIWSAEAGSVDAGGIYTAPSRRRSTIDKVIIHHRGDPGVAVHAIVHVVAPGQVSPTANPQVASYSISPGAPAQVSVEFGRDTGYGFKTWQQPVPARGGPVKLFVAGMKANTLYHMRAIVRFRDGAEFVDADHTFTTGAIHVPQPLAITTSTAAGRTPQAGLELLDPTTPPGPATADVPLVTDLDGNVLWSYDPGLPRYRPNPTKLLPNGHFLVNLGSGTDSVLREVDLAGNLIWQMTAADLNAALATATCAGCAVNIVLTHHDFAPLPNGHLILLAATLRDISGTTVIGDVLIDLDRHRKPVWVWNAFDHLDVNRRPMGFPDWTHSNAVVYSPGDGNLIVSIRHQNWLVKIDYANGDGTGEILWRLGYQGDFALLGGTDPTDWFYAQHDPSFVGRRTAGHFTLALFDNGNDRVFPSGVACGNPGAPACLYSTALLLEIDEAARTARLAFHATAPRYSNFGGNAEVLPNGDLEFCASSDGPGTAGTVYEMTTDRDAPEPVWQMHLADQFVYRGRRLPSLYPGVQWP